MSDSLGRHTVTMETLHKLVSLRSGPRGLPWPALCRCSRSRRGCGGWLPYLGLALTHPHFGSLLLVGIDHILPSLHALGKASECTVTVLPDKYIWRFWILVIYQYLARRYQRIQLGGEGGARDGQGICRFGQPPAASIVLGTSPTLGKGFRKPSSS